jgi:hypothetical protein
MLIRNGHSESFIDRFANYSRLLPAPLDPIHRRSFVIEARQVLGSWRPRLIFARHILALGTVSFIYITSILAIGIAGSTSEILF